MNITVMTLVEVAGVYAFALLVEAAIFAVVIAAAVHPWGIDLNGLPDPKVIVAPNSRLVLFLYGQEHLLLSVCFSWPQLLWIVPQSRRVDLDDVE